MEFVGFPWLQLVSIVSLRKRNGETLLHVKAMLLLRSIGFVNLLLRALLRSCLVDLVSRTYFYKLIILTTGHAYEGSRKHLCNVRGCLLMAEIAKLHSFATFSNRRLDQLAMMGFRTEEWAILLVEVAPLWHIADGQAKSHMIIATLC